MISSFVRFTLYALLLLPISAQEKPSTEKTKEDGKKNESVSTAKDVTTEGSVIIEGKKIPYKKVNGVIKFKCSYSRFFLPVRFLI